ncbi:hypothetical protein AAHE18_U099000 [Arachis hypogaea]
MNMTTSSNSRRRRAVAVAGGDGHRSRRRSNLRWRWRWLWRAVRLPPASTVSRVRWRWLNRSLSLSHTLSHSLRLSGSQLSGTLSRPKDNGYGKQGKGNGGSS